MGSYNSILILPSEIPAFVQRDYYCFGNAFCCFLTEGSASVSLFTEPARFNDAKPYDLAVSDDVWAALKLRVDPIAKRILDPHRAYVGASFLCLLMTAVFAAVRPGWNYKNLSSYEDDEIEDAEEDDRKLYDDYYVLADDYYNNDGVDDIVLAELSYRNEELQGYLEIWRIGFYSSLAVLLLSTLIVAIGMEIRNATKDFLIKEVCEEMRSRFEEEGFSIRYRTRRSVSGALIGHIRPERVIVFKRLHAGADSDISNSDTVGNGSSYSCLLDSNNVSHSRTPPPSHRQQFNTLLVPVPPGYTAGQVVNVITPSGDQIMVAVPRGAKPGQSFPVHIPPQIKQKIQQQHYQQQQQQQQQEQMHIANRKGMSSQPNSVDVDRHTNELEMV